MNDTELDEMLNQWDAPEVPQRLRKRIEAQQPRRWRFTWPSWHVGKGLFAGAVVGSVVFLLAVIGLPGAPAGNVPWTVDSELIKYAADGSSSVEMYMTSYQSNSNEVLLSRSVPGNPLLSVVGRTLDFALPVWARFITPLTIDAATLAKLKQFPRGPAFIFGCDADCLVLSHFGFAPGNSCFAGEITARETILGHTIEATRHRWMDGRMTVSTAPDLGCFALKVTYEEPQSDGSFRVVRAKQAVKVTVNP